MIDRPRTRRPLFVLVLVLAGAVLAAGPGRAQSTFRIAMDSDVATLDPAQAANRSWDSMLAYVAEPLMTIDRSGKIVPDLATDWHRSADGSTLLIHLRRGVTFQDGTPFDAAAVKWNIERVAHGKVNSIFTYPLRSVEAVDVVDAYTVRIRLRLPAADPLPTLSTQGLAMLSPASVGVHGNTVKNMAWPVGTGPYRLAAVKKDAEVAVTRYDAYWGQRPSYQHVTFQIVPNAPTRHAMLLTGQTDLIVAPSRSELPSLEHDPRVTVLMAPGDVSFFVGLNTSKPPLDDRRVRQALNYAVDKQAIIHGILQDTVAQADSVVPPGVFGYTKLVPYAYDVAKAKTLLAQAGVRPGTLTLHMIVPTSHYTDAVTIAQAIAGQLSDVGVRVDIQEMDFATLAASIFKAKKDNTTELFYLGLSLPDMDASDRMDGFDCGWVPPHGENFEFYCNADVTRLVHLAATDPSRAKRAVEYAQAMKIVWADAPAIWLWDGGSPLAYSSAVTNIWGLPNGEFRAVYARPAKSSM